MFQIQRIFLMDKQLKVKSCRKPCPATPQNRYYCTVCERLNKSIAKRCDYSKIKIEGSDETVDEDADDTIFQPLSGDQPSMIGESSKQSGDKVEFKVVAPEKADKDYPLFEFVQPKDKKIEPIEMELLEDVALEFKISDDEPVEVEALEVTPIDEDEYDDDEGGIEVAEVVEVEVFEDSEVESDRFDITTAAAPMLHEFKPVSQMPAPSKGVKSKGPVAAKRKPKKVSGKVAMKPVAKKRGARQVTRKTKLKPKKATKTPKTTPRPPHTVEPTWTPPPSTQSPPWRLEPIQATEPAQVPTQRRIKPVQPTQPQPQMRPTSQPTARPSVTPTLKATKTLVKRPKKVTSVRKVPKTRI
jgi:hypothetical protein